MKKISLCAQKNKWLVIILCVAAVLRFIGTNPGYNKFHSDEGISYSAAVSMIKNGNLDPLRYDYPAVVPLINYFFFKFFFIPFSWVKFYLQNIPEIIDGFVQLPLPPEEYRRIFQLEILGEREINALFWGRYVTALVSFGSVILTYLLGKKLFGKAVGVIAAFLLAVNFRAVMNAHIGLPDTYNAFFLLLSLLVSVGLVEKSNKFYYALAGIAMGLSFSTKYQFFCLFPFLFAHLYISWNKVEKRFDRNKLLNRNVLLSGLLMVLVFVLLNPYFFINFEQAHTWITSVSGKYAAGRNQFNLFPVSYFYHVDYGPALFFLMIIGFLYSLRRYLKQTLFLLGFLVPFFFVTLYYSIGGFYVRNFITITPLLMLFAAVSFGVLYKKDHIICKAVGLILLIAVSLFPLKNSLINVYYYTKPWSYDVIVQKAADVLPGGAIIATHPFDPLPEDILHQRSEFKPEITYSLSELKENNVDYALVNMDWAGNNFYGWMNASLPKSLKYWTKPYNLMRNTFWGLSIEEMMNFVSVSAYKPWQAPDAALFLSKVPYYQEGNFEFVESHTFDKESGLWTEVFNNDSSDSFLSFDPKMGMDEKGSLKIGPGTANFSISRFTSAPIKVKPNHVYRITGHVISDRHVKKDERRVFLRTDYYKEEGGIEGPGILSSVSPRYFGEDWQQLEALSVAPEDAVFVRISLQASGSLTECYWLDDVLVEESRNPIPLTDTFKKLEFDDYKDLLYPNSHGNL